MPTVPYSYDHFSGEASLDSRTRGQSSGISTSYLGGVPGSLAIYSSGSAPTRLADDEDGLLQETIIASLQEAAYNDRRRRSQREIEEEEEAELVATYIAIAEAEERREAEELAQAAAAADAAEEAEVQEIALAAAMEEQAEAQAEQLRRERAAEEEAEAEAARVQAMQAKPPPGVAETFDRYRWLNDESITFAYKRMSELGLTAAGPAASPASCSSTSAGPPSPASCASTSPGGSSCSTACSNSGAKGCGRLPEAVLLVEPTVAFLLSVKDDLQQVEEQTRAMNLQERDLLICPINDSRVCSWADTGTHWTLLVCWDRRAGTNEGPSCTHFTRFSHYDSMRGGGAYGANFEQAQALARRLAGREVQVSVGSCAQQTNSFDCGVYVLLFSEIIAKTFLEAGDRPVHNRGAPPPSSIGAAGARLLRHAAGVASPALGPPPPAWEEKLLAVTPGEVAARRQWYFETFTALVQGAAAVGRS